MEFAFPSLRFPDRTLIQKMSLELNRIFYRIDSCVFYTIKTCQFKLFGNSFKNIVYFYTQYCMPYVKLGIIIGVPAFVTVYEFSSAFRKICAVLADWHQSP